MNTSKIITRRKLLHGATAALVASALANEPMKKRVIVIGGGIGGLSCAFDLMERGHDVTLLEASKRTGGHVKTLRDPLPDGLYADVGAEQFLDPAYEAYRHWVKRFDLPFLEYHRRTDMLRMIRGQWRTEAELADAKTQRAFGFNEREVAYMQVKGWSDLPRLYLGTQAHKFKDELSPFSSGLGDLDHITLADWMIAEGASTAACEFSSAGRVTTKEKPPGNGDVSALYRLWQDACSSNRGCTYFHQHPFRLKGGNQTLPDTFAQHIGDRIRKQCFVNDIAHDADGATVTFTEGRDKTPQTLKADYVVIAVSPMVIAGIIVTPAFPETKQFALAHTPMSMGSRVLLQAKTRFWEGDTVPSINLATGDSNMALVYECASEVPGDSCVLMGTGLPTQDAEEALTAFRRFYPGKNKDSIEQCIVHQWAKEEPLAVGCERTPFALGKLKQIWPHLIEPVGRLYFVGAAYDALPWGQHAATLSSRRAAQAIHEA